MSDDPFRNLWGLGYRRLVPILPPTAQVSPNSAYAKAPGARGKAVGLKGDDGLWRGVNWLNLEATLSDIKRWRDWGAGVGVKFGLCDVTRPDGEWLVGIDSDVRDVAHAATVDKLVHKHFGQLPCRVGNYPKALYPIRLTGAVQYTRVMFGGIDEMSKRHRHAVEILGGMKQAVFAGVHPGTGQPYRWPRPLVPLAALPITTPEKLKAFMDELLVVLPEATTAAASVSQVDRTKVDQDGLRGDLDLLERALQALPNTVRDFPAYDDMTRVGLAVRAATIDDPDRGLEMFTAWVAKWEGDGFDPRLCEKWWDSYKPPFALGARFIYDMAAKLAPASFNIGEVYFEKFPDDGNLALSQKPENFFRAEEGVEEPPAPGRTLRFLPIDEVAERALSATSRPLVDGLLTTGALSVIFGPPGAGKTFVTLRLAHCIAAGADFAGRKVSQGAVAYIAGEGGGGVLARVRALWSESGSAGPAAPLFLLPETVNLRAPDADLVPVAESLRALVHEHGPLSLIVVDTLARAMGGGDENSPVDMGNFVANMDRLRRMTGAHLAIVHHCGKDAARGMRGHSALLGAVDTVLELGDGACVATKQRDLELDAGFGYRLRSVVAGLRVDGEPLKTAVADCSPGQLDAASPEEGGSDGAGYVSPRDRSILDVCRRIDGPFTLQELIDAAGGQGLTIPGKDALRKPLYRLTRAGHLRGLKRGRWEFISEAVLDA